MVDWVAVRNEWSLAPDVAYLNHGSFGPSPRPVLEARRDWQRAMEQQPMKFFVRQFEQELDRATSRLGQLVGATANDLLFVPNATVAMNLVMANTTLQPGDQVLTTNHDYGAVLRAWRSGCKAAGAELVVCKLPLPLESEAIVAAILSAVTERTRLIVVSHVTSPTAAVMPVSQICAAARHRGIKVCIDGPHAIAMRPLDLKALGCDYYCASLHKWLSAPFGSGFLYVAGRHHAQFRPMITSWGGRLNGDAASWKDEFTWFGTHDPTSYLATPAAIDFLESIGLDVFRQRTHALAEQVAERIGKLTQLPLIVEPSAAGFGSMVANAPCQQEPTACPPGTDELTPGNRN